MWTVAGQSRRAPSRCRLDLIRMGGEDQIVVIAAHHSKELLEDMVLLIAGIGPERVALFLIAFNNEQADEVVKPFLGVSLHVEVDMHGTGRKLWNPEHVDLLVPHGESLERVGMAEVVVDACHSAGRSWARARICSTSCSVSGAGCCRRKRA